MGVPFSNRSVACIRSQGLFLFVVLCVHFGSFTVPFSNRSVACISSQGLFYSWFFACILVPSRFHLVTGASPVSVRKDFFISFLLHGFWFLHGSPTVVGASPVAAHMDRWQRPFAVFPLKK